MTRASTFRREPQLRRYTGIVYKKCWLVARAQNASAMFSIYDEEDRLPARFECFSEGDGASNFNNWI